MKVKTKIILLSLFIMLFSVGCTPKEEMDTASHNNTNNTENEELPSLPKQINLPFKIIDMSEIKTGKPETSWDYKQTISIGNDNDNKATLDIYDASKDNSSPYQFNGILRFRKSNYIIRELSDSILKNTDSQINIFERLFSGQDRYELIASIELFANGFGRKLFIVNDLKNDTLKSFEAWGEPSFHDLDNYGADELIIEFEGLHMQFPDIRIIRVEDKNLEICTSVVDNVRRNQGDFAKLLKNEIPPIITISNVEEKEPSYDYKYNNGILSLVEKRH